jgi:DNA-binding LacI/PurR family transcriptional regulator
MAAGVLFALQAGGIDVPGRISVVGIDGHEYAEALGITTVEQDPERQGRNAAQWVLRRLSGEDDLDVPMTPYSLVVRSSTAPPARLLT